MRYLLLASMFLNLLGSASAQGKKEKEMSMMSGVVLDEKGKIVPGAIIKISKKKEAFDIRVGEDGMYYSALLPVGYYHVDIRANNRYYQSQKVRLTPTGESKKFYNFRLQGGGVAALYTDRYDPLRRLNAGEHVPQMK